jgi:hypothetical protein
MTDSHPRFLYRPPIPLLLHPFVITWLVVGIIDCYNILRVQKFVP